MRAILGLLCSTMWLGCQPSPGGPDAPGADVSGLDAPGLDAPGLDTPELPGLDAPSDGGTPTSCDRWPAQGDAPYLSILPGRRGFGLDTVAGSGRGGTGPARVVAVTNLSDAGPGSLRACLEASGPRVCVFEVSGTITASDLEIRQPYVTVAGQTAPSPGITIRGATLSILNTHDVLVQHVRIRVGDATTGGDPSNRDALAVGSFGGMDTHHVVLDHVSLSWSTDEVASLWSDGGTVQDVAILDSIIAEGLRCSIHPEGCHSAGLIIGRDTQRAMVTGSLFAHNDWRNPLVRDAFDEVVVASNLLLGDGSEGIVVRDNLGRVGPSHADVIENELGPARVQLGASDATFSAGSSFFVDSACDVSSCIDDRGMGASPISASRTVTVPGFVPLPSASVPEVVLATAGARPADRDAVDARIVTEVQAGTNRLIDSQDDVGGWPALEENHAAYEDPAEPDAIPAVDPYTGAANPGYTTRELYLHELARRVTCGG